MSALKPAEAHTRRESRHLTVIRLRLCCCCIFWSLGQNNLPSIKVMKGRVSKKDEEEQEDEQERFYGVFNISSRNLIFFDLYVI